MDRTRRTAAYKKHSSNIVDVPNDLLNKGEAQFDETRHAEMNAEDDVAML